MHVWNTRGKGNLVFWSTLSNLLHKFLQRGFEKWLTWLQNLQSHREHNIIPEHSYFEGNIISIDEMQLKSECVWCYWNLIHKLSRECECNIGLLYVHVCAWTHTHTQSKNKQFIESLMIKTWVIFVFHFLSLVP